MFTLTINLDASTGEDVADLLRRTANLAEHLIDDTDQAYIPVQDRMGNTVGYWKFSRNE